MELKLDDDYIWTPDYSKIPKERLNIPGLHMIGRARFKKAWEALATHYHNTLEVVVVINGNQQYIVNDTVYSLYGGKMFITHPYEIHGNGTLPQNICEFIWFQLDLDCVENFLGLSGSRADHLHYSLANCSNRTIDVEHKDLDLLQRAWDLITAPQTSKQLQGYTCLLQFIVTYFCSDNQRQMDQNVSPDIHRAIRYINANLTTDLRLCDIANSCNLSESHFKTKFRKQMGITPLGYITQQKIERAKKLLKCSNASITDIALGLNFSTSNYFASVFKQYTGYSPSEFRNEERFLQD